MRHNKTLIILLLISFLGFGQDYELMQVHILNSNEEFYLNPTDGGLNAPEFSTMDIDQDGVDEIILYERNAKTWIVYKLNSLNSNYILDYQLSTKLPILNQDIALLRDYNCDGKKDLIVDEGNTLVLYLNKSNITNVTFEREGVLVYGSSLDSIFNRNYDLPGMADIDFDGDLDILCYGVNGIYLEYYKNTSIENFGVCDSISFELANYCWGHFSEDNTSSGNFELFLLDTCLNNVVNPQKLMIHTGSTITPLDYNGDSVMDLLVGDIGYSNMVYAENFGNSVNANSSLINSNSSFPSGTMPISVDRFPAAYWEDFNGDGTRDLMVAPNTDLGSNNQSAISYYENFGSNLNPLLNLVSNSFLQNEMIDYGTRSNLSLCDFNNDGNRDMAMGSYGLYDDGMYVSSLNLLINESTLDSLKFQEVNDFAELSQFGFKAIAASIRDLNNDGYQDVLFGDESGKIHLAIGDQNGGFIYQFDLLNTEGNIIDVGQYSSPQLIDFDGDNDFDLIIGNRYGNLSYLENTGNASNFDFDSITNEMGGVNVLRDLTNGGYAKPFFYKNNQGFWEAYVGSYTGQNFKYSVINADPTVDFVLIDSLDFNFGINTSLLVDEFNDDTCFILGTDRGGITFFKENKSFVSTTLTPIDEIMNISMGEGYVKMMSNRTINRVELIDMKGKLVKSIKPYSNEVIIHISKLPKGIYLLNATANDGALHHFKFLR